MASRLELASADFLGRPYRVNPLVGSAETPEVFVADTDDGFDCVTYVETVLARASARNSREFSNRLKRLRYRSGQISWIGRNHYMTNWIRNNVRQGIIREIRLTPSIAKKRVLDAIAGLPPQKQNFRCFPKRRLPKAAGKLRSGDLLFFASIRQDLDVFHCGILIKSGNRLLLRHASRSQGAVVEQELPDFLKKNRMAGVIVARPIQQD